MINPELMKLVELMPAEDQEELVRKFKPLTKNIQTHNCDDDPVESYFRSFNVNADAEGDEGVLPLPNVDWSKREEEEHITNEEGEDILELPCNFSSR